MTSTLAWSRRFMPVRRAQRWSITTVHTSGVDGRSSQRSIAKVRRTVATGTNPEPGTFCSVGGKLKESSHMNQQNPNRDQQQQQNNPNQKPGQQQGGGGQGGQQQQGGQQKPGQQQQGGQQKPGQQQGGQGGQQNQNR